MTKDDIDIIISDNGNCKSITQQIRFGKDLLKIRFTILVEQGLGMVRCCSYHTNYKDDWKQESKDIEFNDKIKEDMNNAQFIGLGGLLNGKPTQTKEEESKETQGSCKV